MTGDPPAGRVSPGQKIGLSRSARKARRSMLGPMAQQSSRPHFSPGQASGDAAAQAFRDLAATVAEIEAHYIGEGRGMHTPEERAAGRYLVANALQHGFQCWFEADPERPLFQRWLSPTKKLLGDNPDALYYGAIVNPAGTYRIRGNVHGACYTSFAVEAGAMDGSFRMVVAQRDPGVPNWIDAAGLPTGMIFWRFLLPEENVPPIETELVDVASVAHST
jgi:hypothetical protein